MVTPLEAKMSSSEVVTKNDELFKLIFTKRLGKGLIKSMLCE